MSVRRTTLPSQPPVKLWSRWFTTRSRCLRLQLSSRHVLFPASFPWKFLSFVRHQLISPWSSGFIIFRINAAQACHCESFTITTSQSWFSIHNIILFSTMVMMEWKLNKLMTLVRNKNWVTSYKIFFDIFTSAFYNSHIREVISQFKVFKKKKKTIRQFIKICLITI